jgi:RNA polymerase sigma-70 factor (ECF subfamily)
VQNCLLAIWKAMPSYEYGKNGATFRTWAAVVARRVVIDHCRRRDRRIKTNSLDDDGDIYLEPGHGDDAYLDFVEREWRTYLVNLAFERIRPNFSDKAIGVFEAALAGRTPRDIAERFEVKQDYVRKLRSRVGKRLQREIRHLRAELE